MNDQSLNELESVLGQIRPSDTSVTSGRVMYEAGRADGLRLQQSRNRTKLKLWQLATVCSLLIACGSIAIHLQSPSDDGLQLAQPLADSSSPDGMEPSLTSLASETTAAPTSTNTGLHRLFGIRPNRVLAQRQAILDGDRIAEPAITLPLESTSRKLLIENLITEQGL